MDDGEFTEVLVERHQYTSFPVCMSQDFFVAWIFGPIARPYDIMARGLKLTGGPIPDARVEQELQWLGSKTIGSIRSCPTRRLA